MTPEQFAEFWRDECLRWMALADSKAAEIEGLKRQRADWARNAHIEIERYKREVLVARAEIRARARKADDLKEELAGARTKIGTLEYELTGARTHSHNLEFTLASARAELAAKIPTIAEQVRLRKRAEAGLAHRQQELDRLNTENGLLNRQLEELKELRRVNIWRSTPPLRQGSYRQVNFVPFPWVTPRRWDLLPSKTWLERRGEEQTTVSSDDPAVEAAAKAIIDAPETEEEMEYVAGISAAVRGVRRGRFEDAHHPRRARAKAARRRNLPLLCEPAPEGHASARPL